MNGPLTLTGHPIQRAGARAVAELAGRDHPDDVTGDDLDGVAAQLVEDVYRAASVPKEQSEGHPAYDWWKVLNALFPNAPATHSVRLKWADLKERIAALFEVGTSADSEVCVFCDQPATARWAKDSLPLFDTSKARNNLPPSGAGWPICRGCRIAVWAMPYGAAVTSNSATVLTADGGDAAERDFVRQQLRRAKQIQTLGLGGATGRSPEAVVVRMLRTLDRPEIDTPDGVVLWMFKNDNQEPWLRVTETRRPIARFVQGLATDPLVRRGWSALGWMLAARGGTGKRQQTGADMAARTLFEPAGRPTPRLLETVFGLVTVDPDRYGSRTWKSLTALARHYAKEYLVMDLSTVQPVAELIARWIAATDNPRGRFGEYVTAARSGYQLGQLLMMAEARLLLDKRPEDPPLPMRATDAQHVVSFGADAGQRRMLLFFAVVDLLVANDIQFGKKSTDADDEVDSAVGQMAIDDDELVEEQG